MCEFDLHLNLKNFKDLCLRAGTSVKELEYFRFNKTRNVYKFEKHKTGSKKLRIIHSPHDKYKFLLRRLNKSLLEGSFPTGVFGGVKGKQVSDVAEMHCGREAILSLDLKDFFPRITSSQVTAIFRRSGCSPAIAELLTELVTYEGTLPQGFPTSTAIANWVAYDLDIQHLAFCDKRKIRRTRWVDDITFSGRYDAIREAIPSLIGAIKFHKFRLSNKKTEFTPRKHCEKVLGLDVSSATPRVPQGTVRRIQRVLQDCKDYGIHAAALNYELQDKNLRASLHGHVRYIERHNPVDGSSLRTLLESIRWE